MPDYQKMYTTLFNAMTDAIALLQNAQHETEEVYISSDTASTAIPDRDGDNL